MSEPEVLDKKTKIILGGGLILFLTVWVVCYAMGWFHIPDAHFIEENSTRLYPDLP